MPVHLIWQIFIVSNFVITCQYELLVIQFLRYYAIFLNLYQLTVRLALRLCKNDLRYILVKWYDCLFCYPKRYCQYLWFIPVVFFIFTNQVSYNTFLKRYALLFLHSSIMPVHLVFTSCSFDSVLWRFVQFNAFFVDYTSLFNLYLLVVRLAILHSLTNKKQLT